MFYSYKVYTAILLYILCAHFTNYNFKIIHLFLFVYLKINKKIIILTKS